MSKPKNIFLVAVYAMKPKDHVNTSVAGWMKDANNIRYDEQVAISRGLRSKDMHAQVILDLTNKHVERNSFNTGKTFDEIFRYFLDNYTQYVAQTMAQLDPGYLDSVVKSIEQEIASTPDVQEAVINATTETEQRVMGDLQTLHGMTVEQAQAQVDAIKS